MICMAGVASVVLLICLKPCNHGTLVLLMTVEWSIKDVKAGDLDFRRMGL